MDIAQIISIVLGILAAFFGGYLLIAKNVITEVKLLFTILSDAIADDTLTKAELAAIVAQFKKILSGFKRSSVQEATAVISKMGKKK